MREHPPYIQEAATEAPRSQRLFTILQVECRRVNLFTRDLTGAGGEGVGKSIGGAYRSLAAHGETAVFFMAIGSLEMCGTPPPMYKIRQR